MTVNRLFFVQHGLAVNKAENPERPLSEEGVQQTQRVASQLVGSGTVISGIFHSGKLRAQQTADIIADVLKLSSSTRVDNLSPNDDISLIKPRLNMDQAMYVGHLPHLEKLVSSLVTGNETPAIMKFRNSAVVCLEQQDGRFHIAWYLTPQLLNGKS